MDLVANRRRLGRIVGPFAWAIARANLGFPERPVILSPVEHGRDPLDGGVVFAERLDIACAESHASQEDDAVGADEDPGYTDDDLLVNVGAVFFQLIAGLMVGAIMLVAFTTAMGRSAEIFGRQRIYRSRWMWLAPILVATPIIMLVLGIDRGGPALSVVLTVMATGLMVGFVEEQLYRGITVKMLRSEVPPAPALLPVAAADGAVAHDDVVGRRSVFG